MVIQLKLYIIKKIQLIFHINCLFLLFLIKFSYLLNLLTNYFQKLKKNLKQFSINKYKFEKMQYSQHILYSIKLPNFLIQFKNKCNIMIVPHLIEFKNYVNEQNNDATVHPIITIIAILIIVYSIQAVIKGLFGNNQLCNDLSHKKNYNQSPQLSRQLNDLKKQLKGLYTSFNQLSKQLKNKKVKANKSVQKISQVSLTKRNQHTDENLLKLWKQFIPIYNNSIQNNKKLALYILQTQEQMFLQLKKLKKTNRLSSSSGRPSTIRNKTSQKKLLTLQKPKQKKSLPPLKQNIIQQQNNAQIHISKQAFSNKNYLSTSTLSTTVIPSNIQHSDSNNSVDKQPQNKMLQTPAAVKVPLMKNIKPPLPKVLKKLPAKITNFTDKDLDNNQQSLIKRSDQNIISPLKIQKNQQFIDNINEANNKPEITQRTQIVVQTNQQKTEKKPIQSPQQSKQSKQIIEQQKTNQSYLGNIFPTPNFQKQENLQQNADQNQQSKSNQPLIAPPKFIIKKPNPPSKANICRRGPPPPTRM